MQPNRFNDFGSAFTIFGWCPCGHYAPIRPPPDNPTIPELKRRLVCRACGAGGGGISIAYTAAGGFQYGARQR